jgi:pimeloyl-ACP methyl ester carboxylesterase
MNARSILAACAGGALMSAAACTSPGATGTSPDSTMPTASSSQAPSAACPTGGESEVHVDNAYGTLYATLLLPAGCGPFTTMLIVPGSGPTDRDGNNTMGVGANTYRLLAQGLAAKNVASLRYDKGGIAASAGAAPKNEADMRFEMGANDAALLVRALRKDPRVGHVVIAGHSEGSLLAMLASKQAKVDGYVSIAGAGRPIADVLREQLAKSLTGALLTTANGIIASLEKGQLVDTVPAALQSVFRPSVQPYLVSWFKYDPTKELRLVAAPALIVQGTTDIQVDVDDAKRLAAARADAKLILLDGMCHVLKEATLDKASQNAAYTSPSLPITPALIDDLVAFAKN